MSRRSGRTKNYAENIDGNMELHDEETNNYEAEAEDELDEEQEVTRCICGQDELNGQTINKQLLTLLWNDYQIKIDQGLFIQCDKCSVWQHGYCVGLFVNDDVPDKYWCEICKPELHVFIYEGKDPVRSLYKPVNDKRKKLLLDSIDREERKNSQGKGKRSSSDTPPPSSETSKSSRKERKHYEETYDEQLQRALRESAQESGVAYEEPQSNGRIKRKRLEEATDNTGKRTRSKPEPENDHADHEDGSATHDEGSKLKKSRIKHKAVKNSSNKGGNSASSGQSSNSNGRNGKSLEEHNQKTMPKDALVSQPSKPRYVNEKSSIYELRKRTGAILEWLGRSQLELEEEKSSKIELFSYIDRPSLNESLITQQNEKVIGMFNENLQLMEQLTEKILLWEEKFGRYAP